MNINNKRKETKKEIYNDEFYGLLHGKELIKYYNEKYGVDYPMQITEVKIKQKQTINNRTENEKRIIIEKTINTNQEKYGYDWPAQSPDINCSSHRLFYNNLYFDSEWEFKFYKYLIDNNIKFEYKPKIVLKFKYDGEIRTYKPDFIVNGVITEIKGDHFFKDGKMICPYHKKEDTEETIKWRNGLFEAKHQCMIKNGVKILKYKELKELGVL